MLPPTSKQGVQKLLGTVNYFGRFISNLSERIKNLLALLKRNHLFDWTSEHKRVWQELCDLLSTAPVLAVFDQSQPSKITADSSSFTLGTALL